MWSWTLAAHGRLDQERQLIDSRNMHGIMILRRKSTVVTSLSSLPTPRQKPARKVALPMHFPTIPPCSTKVDVLDTGDVPILFSLSQMKNLCTTIELDPKGDNITCPAFGLSSSPAEHSTMGHIVLDLTNIACQSTTKSREQPGQPKRHVTFAMSERRPAYPAHAPDMDQDQDEDDKALVRPASRKKSAQEKRDPDTDDEDLSPLIPPRPTPAAPVRKRKKGPPALQDPAATLEHEVPKRLARANRRYLNFGQKSRR